MLKLRLVAVLSLLVVSCGGTQGGGGSGGTSGAGGTSGEVCIPGASASCTCTSGAMGAQVCNASGSGYLACTCSGSGTGGAAASGGASGAAGATGVAGSTGSGGAVATGGSAGGRAGASGAAGAGGSAGAKGGAGGSAGATGSAGAKGAGGENVDAGTTTDGHVSSSTDGGSSYTGRWVSVEIVDAIIGPGKADGTAWDGTGVSIPTSVLNALGTALAGGDPVGGTLAVLAGPDLNNAISSLDKPDPYGWAQATIFGGTGDAYWLAQPSEAVQNNYTPIWPDVWRYINVPIDSDVRILVSLWDSDLVNDDPIGAAEINSTNLMDALAAQKKLEVRVDDQTDGQLLFIGISVVQQTGLM